VIQPVHHLHVCADPTPAESAATESAAEPLHSITDYVADSAVASAAPTDHIIEDKHSQTKIIIT
jgi:hypothetical protein